MRSCLFMLSDECKLRGLTLHCALVNTVILMRTGKLQVINCTLLDDSSNSQSDFAQGIVAMAGAKVLVENCTFDNFYSGIVVHKGAQVELRNCVMKNCGVGIQMYIGSQVSVYSSTIVDCSEQCIRCEVVTKTNDYHPMEGLLISEDSKVGLGKDTDIFVVEQNINLI
ncbi:unnamed protein product [Diatraea saccharalis]|uniref:Right handed beta helix domain-containing protein n=1 Tax=Diatraea saccharalis TaxID=40085 RepID=A0A9N9R7X8_9NEOP|nr:unnamed protein product [Diatraea saccharalis]